MKKILVKILLILSFILIPSFSFANNNIKITNENTGRDTNNDYLNEIEGNDFFYVGTTGEKGIKYFLLNIARDLRVIVFALVLFFAVIMVIKLIFGENTDEEQKKLKMGIIWASVGIIVMQIAFSVYKVMFDYSVDNNLANKAVEKLIEPFTEMLMLLASFAFLAMGIYAFYKIITAGGDDEGIKKGKSIIFQAIIGFIVIKFADIIVKNTFNPDCGGGGILHYYGTSICQNVTGNAKIITTLLNWFNTFLAIIMVLMIIYAGFLVLTGAGDDEKQKKAKKILLYIGIGMLILVGSYLILTFFINKF
ncbi:hypothetical protein H3C61_02625 [Candidatus Gracilibacteria bacterium]|nr:hypothetical protein [Candidatus Gracilibacteria bacterium]